MLSRKTQAAQNLTAPCVALLPSTVATLGFSFVVFIRHFQLLVDFISCLSFNLSAQRDTALYIIKSFRNCEVSNCREQFMQVLRIFVISCNELKNTITIFFFEIFSLPFRNAFASLLTVGCWCMCLNERS